MPFLQSHFVGSARNGRHRGRFIAKHHASSIATPALFDLLIDCAAAVSFANAQPLGCDVLAGLANIRRSTTACLIKPCETVRHVEQFHGRGGDGFTDCRVGFL